MIKKKYCQSYDVSGMSLLELMVALAIIALVNFYVIPSYQNYIRRGHRLAACTALYRAAQMIESSVADSNRSASSKARALPAGFEQAPPDAAAVYRLRLRTQNEVNGGYTIEAEPVRPGPMSDDVCGKYLLDANGRRSNEVAGGATQTSADIVTYCWQGR